MCYLAARNRSFYVLLCEWVITRKNTVIELFERCKILAKYSFVKAQSGEGCEVDESKLIL